jgi:hypothetical protein
VGHGPTSGHLSYSSPFAGYRWIHAQFVDSMEIPSPEKCTLRRLEKAAAYGKRPLEDRPGPDAFSAYAFYSWV